MTALPVERFDPSRYPPLPRRGREQASRDRLAQVAEDFPSVTADAHQWLATDDDVFATVVRDVIKVGLPRPKAGPRRRPTPEEARADWRRFIIAVTGTPPEPPEPARPLPRPQRLTLAALMDSNFNLPRFTL